MRVTDASQLQPMTSAFGSHITLPLHDETHALWNLSTPTSAPAEIPPPSPLVKQHSEASWQSLGSSQRRKDPKQLPLLALPSKGSHPMPPKQHPWATQYVSPHRTPIFPPSLASLAESWMLASTVADSMPRSSAHDALARQSDMRSVRWFTTNHRLTRRRRLEGPLREARPMTTA